MSRVWNLTAPGLVAQIEDSEVKTPGLHVVIAGDLDLDDVKKLRERLDIWLRRAQPSCPQCYADEAINRANGHPAQAERCRAYCLSGHNPSVIDEPVTDPEQAYRQRCAVRRSFFAARSPGDHISWGMGRSGVIQTIEEEYVTILDDGWPADPPLCVHTPPFVARIQIDCMINLQLVRRHE